MGLWRYMIIILLLCPKGAYALCPGSIWGQELSSFLGQPRDTIRLFAYDKRGREREIPIQVDPVDFNGKLVFYKKGEPWQSRGLAQYDRISFELKDFGVQLEDMKTSCEDGAIQEVVSSDGRYAYFTHCKRKFPVRWQNPVVHDAPERTVESPYYRYRYTSENHLMFSQLELAFDHPYSYPYTMAKSSDQLIRGDLKKFFTLSFGADDFEAKITAERLGAVGLVGRLSFILSVMMFEIDLALSPEVSFYRDSIHIPMVMQLPVNAPDYVHKGSGLFYSWQPGRDVIWADDLTKMPEFGRDKGALSYCRQDKCVFRLVGEVGFQYFVMEFSLARPLVEKGFYPLLIKDLSAFEKKKDYSISRFSPEGRIAVYFETSSLAKGNHAWDFWIRFNETRPSLKSQCSAYQVSLGRI